MESIVQPVLDGMSSLKKPQRFFMLVLLRVLMSFQGRATYRNLSRYCEMSEKRLSRWYGRDLGWVEFNQRLLLEHLSKASEKVAAIDASFMSKSGRHTEGLGWFYHGATGRAERGLEISLVSIIDIAAHTAYALDARQTLDKEDKSRTDTYADQVVSLASHLKAQGVEHVAADAYYSKETFVTPVLDVGLHIVGKLRSDANLRSLYTGAYSGRGRPKRYNGKINLEGELKELSALGEIEIGLQAWTAIVYSVMLRRNVRVVVLRLKEGEQLRQAVLYSTDTKLSARKIIDYYRARFQIEFVFRDAKQHTGLTHCQSRKSQAINNHVNASLTALNVLKVEDRERKNTTEKTVISIASWKRRKFNQNLMEKLFDKLDLTLNCQKIRDVFDELSEYGTVAA